MELISISELSKKLKRDESTLRRYLYRPEFAPYRAGHKIYYCDEIGKWLKSLYKKRKKRKKRRKNALNKKRKADPAPILLQE